MAWYRAGTIAVTNGSTAITGTGTAWVANAQAGHAINLPDGRAYEVAAIVSDTSISLGSAYLGSTASSQSYSIQPNEGFAQQAATLLASFIATFSGYVSTALAGRFGDGSAGAPGITFAADQDTGLVRLGNNLLGIATAGTVRGTFDDNGYFGLGTTTPQAPFDVRKVSAGTEIVMASLANRSSVAGTAVSIELSPANVSSPSLRAAQISAYNDGGDQITMSFRTCAGGSTPINRWQIYSSGHFAPAADNIYAIANSTYRVSVVYAATGSINTSDAREKEWRGALTSAEMAAAKDIMATIGVYRWIKDVEDKGDAARLHVGPRAQSVWGIMADHGLIDPITPEASDSLYAFLCYDVWTASPALIDAKGAMVRQAVEAGDRYGIRPDELAYFLLAGMEQRLAALEPA